MKNLKSSILAIFTSSVISFSWVFAAWIDHFEVNFNPENAKVWEAIDLTIEAVDKNNITIFDYDGTVLIFSESDPQADLPSTLSENTYTFSEADQWKVKFENSVKFKEVWEQNIHVYDLNDDTVFWVAEANIEKEEDIEIIEPVSTDISIISPKDWLIVWESSIKISWTTNKNFQVKIIVNWDNEFTTISNNEWNFEKTVENLVNWDNEIIAQIIDAEWKVIWKSESITVKFEIDNLEIKNIQFTPEIIYPENSFKIDIVANKWLSEVKIILNDIITILKETQDWIYSWKMHAPIEMWTYKVDVTLTDELWHKKTEIWAATLNVLELKSAEPKVIIVEPEPIPVVVPKEIINIEDLEITGLKLVELKTKSVLTWDKIDIADSYNIYKRLDDSRLELIQNVKEEKFEVEILWKKITHDYFVVRAMAKTDEWELFEWNFSKATKVKTGPEILILFLISLFIGWLIFTLKKNA